MRTSRPLTPVPFLLLPSQRSSDALVLYYTHSFASLPIILSFLTILTSVWKNPTVLSPSFHLCYECCWSLEIPTDDTTISWSPAYTGILAFSGHLPVSHPHPCHLSQLLLSHISFPLASLPYPQL